jgi:choline monooxygenase
LGSWQLAARVEQVDDPGAFVTHDIAGEPVVVVRGEDGRLRAFANVCRHRAARVVEAEHGRASRLRCRYHGWTYDLAGRLRGTPEFEGVEEFSREDQGLAPLSVESWGPWVFVHCGPNPPPLAEAIAPLPARSDAESLRNLRFAERVTYEIACNWKVFVDNYLDGGYHVNTVHPGLAGVLDYSQYRSEIFGQTSVQLSPIKPLDRSLADAGVASVRAGNVAQYWWIYPNLMINIYENIMDVNLVMPLDPEHCRVVFDYYFASSVTQGARAQSMRVADQIQREDMGICEEVQRGLRSSTYDTGRFCVRREAAGYHFHRLLAQALRGGI